jgi:uncharacterized protein (TIGR03437 family)
LQTPSGSSAPATLTATPSSFTLAAGASTTVSIQASSAQPITGTVEGFLAVASQNTGRTLTVSYWGDFLFPSTSGVINAASLGAGPTAVAAGSWVSIFGSQMTPGAVVSATSVPLPTSLAGITVFIGGTPAPLLYVSPTQINAQIPQEVAGRTTTSLQVVVNAVASAAATINLASTGPGIYTLNQSGSGRGAILHSGSHFVVSSTDPAKPGEILEVYANGLGATNPLVATGQAASSNPLSSVIFGPSASIGNLPATVRFAGLAATFVGLYQVNVEVPSNAPVGDDVLVLTSNGVASNPVIVSVGR